MPVDKNVGGEKNLRMVKLTSDNAATLLALKAYSGEELQTTPFIFNQKPG
jgi:hypothetical protein